MIFIVPLQRKHIKSDISALQRLLFSVVVDMSPLSYSEVLAIYLRIRRQRFFYLLCLHYSQLQKYYCLFLLITVNVKRD